ncbi:MAG: SGNH/GDSL hydrolase family protein [Bacteroidota bacterium]
MQRRLHSGWQTCALSAWLLVVLSVSACTSGRAVRGAETPAWAEQQSQPTIVVLGSSTAQGGGASAPELAWVNRLQVYANRFDPPVRIVNLARGGYTTYHVLPSGMKAAEDRPAPDSLRNVTRALVGRPDVIIINLPSNDAAFGYGLAEQIGNMDRVIEEAERAGSRVWITTSQPRNLDEPGRRALTQFRDWAATAHRRQAVDVWTELALPDGRIQPGFDSGDGIHLNDEGHRIIFERVRAAGVVEAAIDGWKSRLSRELTLESQ